MDDKLTEVQESWRKGYEAGARATEQRNSEEIRIGKAIMEVMYEKFEQRKEDY